MSHYQHNIHNVDYDLFDAISRRIEIKYIGWDNRSVQIFEESYRKNIALLRQRYGNKEIP